MNKQEFEQFVRSEYRGLVRFAEIVTNNKSDAEDAVQEAVLSLWADVSGQNRLASPKHVTPSLVRRRVVDRARNILQSRKDRALDSTEQETVLYTLYGVTSGCGRRITPRKGSE